MANVNILEEAKNVFDIEINELEKLKNKIDERFTELAKMIIETTNNKNKIVIAGIGKSGIIGKKMAATLSSTGTTTIFMNAAEAIHGDLGIIDEGDIVVIISNSGSSDEIINIIEPIKRIGAKVVAFTGNEKSKLGVSADLIINIGVEKEACPMGIAPMSSTTATLVMSDALAVVLMKLRDFKPENFALYHPGGSLGKRLLLKVKDLMHAGDEMPIVTKDEHIEDILMILSNKNMGAVCVVEDHKLLGIITEGDIRRALSNKQEFFNYKAKDIMTENPITITQDILAVEALEVMENRKSQISVLPVTEKQNKKLLGIIRIHDLVGLR